MAAKNLMFENAIKTPLGQAVNVAVDRGREKWLRSAWRRRDGFFDRTFVPGGGRMRRSRLVGIGAPQRAPDIY